ncbi:MAG TPA: hypothetical protein VHT51_19385 [Micropepsaceae bacterium]|nr:hypothetical protein [Micropepsaceae bacterium]
MRAMKTITIAGTAMLTYGIAAGEGLGAADSPPNFAPNPSVGWVAFAPNFIAPKSGVGPVADDPAHPRVSNDDFRAGRGQPTFPIGDLNSPLLLPWAREQMRPYNERVLAGKAAYSKQASCWPIGVPGFLLYPVQPVYFIQTPKEVVMIWQADHEVRHVYLNVPHSAQVKPSWYGESVGHYEGDTLVIDTIGVDIRTVVDNYQTPHTDRLHTIERFHMIDGGKTLEVNLHVEDPGAFTMPWNAIQRYHRVEPRVAETTEAFNPNSSTSDAGPLIEASCAENPNSLFGAEGALPVPQTTKPDF